MLGGRDDPAPAENDRIGRDNPAPTENDSMKKILIVEDVELNVDLLTQLLEDEYTLVVANDGGRGVEMAAQENPDLILMDMSLPVLDGYEATRQIKANDALVHIPIIGLSAHAMSGDAEKARAAGCDDYLTKPVNDELLFQKLEQFLK
jgi:CheY-like chemotaxis protein